MHHPILRRIVLALLLLTFVGGSGLSAAAQAAALPCMIAMQASGDPAGSMPCERSMPGCTKQICCMTSSSPSVLVAPPGLVLLPQSAVRYITVPPEHGGRSVEPELFPPITI